MLEGIFKDHGQGHLSLQQVAQHPVLPDFEQSVINYIGHKMPTLSC